MISQLLKKYWTGVAAVLVLVIIFLYTKVNLPQNLTNAQLAIHFENGKIRKFEGTVVNNMTMLEALYSSSAGDEFDLRYSIGKDGSVVLAKIGDAINFGDKNWHFYLNGKPVKTSDINRTKIKAGDLIEAKYE